MRALRLLPALLCAATLTACGGGVDREAYIQDVKRVQQRTEGDARRVSAEMEKADTPAEVGARLEELGLAVRRNADELARIEPPEEVAGQHSGYAKLLRDYGTSLTGYADRVEEATPQTINELFEEAGKLTQQLSERERALITEINARLQR